MGLGSIFTARAEVRVGRERALDSLVQVIVETRFGTVRRASGYLFGSSGNVATPYHVVSDARRIQVFHADLGIFTVSKVRRVDPRSNLSVLVLNSTVQVGTSFAHLSDSRQVKPGDLLYVLHHPVYGESVEYETTAQTVGYARQMASCPLIDGYAPEQTLIELSGAFDCGSAGGLVLNENYDLVGLILGGQAKGNPRKVYALASNVLAQMMNGGYLESLDTLRSSAGSDAALFDKMLGPAPQPLDFNSPMPEGHLVWFAPMPPMAFENPEFTTEVNDKIKKNWFYTADLIVDNRPLREWSAGRIMIMPAAVNPWNLSDAADRLIHFDADSKFSKVIYKNRETEERIMTRYLLALPLTPGQHSVQYHNKGANFKSTGIVRKKLTIEPSKATMIDITGLSLVSMKLLPRKAAGVGEKQSVHYELERRPLDDRELGFMLRRARFPLK
jgi:hypothetical protein